MEENAEKVRILREWIAKQPHLPKKNHVNLIKRFLHCSNDSIERAKKLIDLFYTLRSQIPEVYSHRDPNSPEIKEAFTNIQFLPLPKFTKENYQIFMYRLLTNDVDKYDFVNGAKAFSIVADVRMVEENTIADGEIPIFDMKNFTLKHLTKIVFPLMKKISTYSEEAHPMKLKQVHYVNAPPFFDRFLSLLKPIIKKDVLKMVHFHLPNSDTLFDYIPRDLLPEEYGGTVGRCNDLNKKWVELVLKWRDYVLDEDYWNVDESKRIATDDKVNVSQYFGIQGSFKS
ncbi:unnamed protein product, partial [Psylliodes chrysocephalus]